MKASGMWLAYTAMWLATAAAVSFAIYFTKNVECLWALLIPTFVSLSSRSGGVS